MLTGIRRCGKSTVLKLLAKELKNLGIDGRRIIYIPRDFL
ncbi:AAA family ATPase [Taylorella equigenitalis]